ncbi:MAG: homoserine O-acetyltransferase [Bacteroides sp.]|nr:homoserine O-acetyltransferase [Bacteroides sp.]MCM1380208.1 homoserine O-acetyltransferase [Bacteroides sp.]MCM1446134.1 homoserine O-acetyltransferase [Prevotella sp.]
MVLTFHDPTPLQLESGAMLPELDIAYHTYGKLNAERSNVIWVCHALTANSDVADWWPHTVEAGRFLDPEKYFIVCANILGSHYGTTGPLSTNPATGKPYYNAFPEVTVRDMVAAHRRLANHLGIQRVELLIGSSLGGFQAMEWALTDSDFAKRIALIATSAYTTPWAAAFNESQRMAIEADATYGSDTPDAGMAGLSAARSIALLSYRGPEAYNRTQADADERPTLSYRKVHSYQQHQGKKLCSRFNAYSYMRLSRAVDAHDVGRNRGGIKAALSSIKSKALIVGITSDILFTTADAKFLADNIPGAALQTIESNFGHDGFLVEHEKLNSIISKFLES